MVVDSARQKPQSRKRVGTVLAALILFAVGSFYLSEWFDSRLAVEDFSVSLNPVLLLLALALCLLSQLADALIWRMVLNRQLIRRPVGFLEIVSILYTSGMLRYLPGRLWNVITQALWLGKYGVGKAVTLYVNLLCMTGLLFFSLYTGLLYLAVHGEGWPKGTLFASFVLVLTVNTLFNLYGELLVNVLLRIFSVRLRLEIAPIQFSAGGTTAVQLVYFASWLLLGAAVYSLAQGLGLPVVAADLLPLLAAMSLSWLAGLLALVVPAGMGVREGVMLWLLKPLVAVQTALLLPIVARVLLLVVDLLLAVVALFFGWRRQIFTIYGHPDR